MQLHRVDQIAKVTIAATLVSGGVLLAVELAKAAEPAPASGLFRYLDANHDNFVSRQEASRIDGFTRPFNDADDNHDGRLSRDEFVKAQAIHDRIRGSAVFEDGLITAKVKTALVREGDLKSLLIGVETYDGQVVLSGAVASGSQSRHAAEVAASVAGVGSVKNGLQVRSNGSS